MSYLSDKVTRVLTVLQLEKTRCTYGALAEYIGATPRDVSKFLTPKRAEASWVVNKKSGLPTGYEAYQLHPDLQSSDKVIDQAADLEKLISR
jgi:alkylated DNA nucleotide flippase Atl1